MNIALKVGGVGTAKMNAGLRALNGSDVLVGIPEGNSRVQRMLDRAMNLKPTKTGKPTKAARRLIKQALKGDVTNAELMFIHTNGSPVRGIPARPVIEPAIAQPDTAAQIAKQLAAAATAALDGDQNEMERRLNRAGVIGESASKKWFTNPANNWRPNAPATIRAKGSDKPLIDTGELRRAITHVVEIRTIEQQHDKEDAENKKVEKDAKDAAKREVEMQNNSGAKGWNDINIDENAVGETTEAVGAGAGIAEEAGAVGESVLGVAGEAGELADLLFVI